MFPYMALNFSLPVLLLRAQLLIGRQQAASYLRCSLVDLCVPPPSPFVPLFLSLHHYPPALSHPHLKQAYPVETEKNPVGLEVALQG
jgi:hypothetical protein